MAHTPGKAIKLPDDHDVKPALIDYAVVRLGLELEKRQEQLNAELRSLKEEKQRIEGELRNLVEAIAVGNGSPAIMVAITERENRIRAITNQLLEQGPGSLQEKLEELRAIAMKHLTETRRLLAKPENIHEARAALAEMFGTFTLSPISDSGEWSYTAKGAIDFFGETAVRVDGAGGGNRTERMPVHFKWLAAA